ncbi:MAG: hypothetical protein WBD41_02755 [Rhodococcus sp. (in: high G+C Gram-positive bacteria)]
MSAHTEAARWATLSLAAEEAVHFPETLSVEKIRELGQFTRAVLSSTATSADDPDDAVRGER